MVDLEKQKNIFKKMLKNEKFLRKFLEKKIRFDF